jgi:hypothetical protein
VAGGQDSIGYDAASDTYHAFNYSYVLPQVETVEDISDCGPRFSFVAVDGTSDPPSLVSGEYDSGSVEAPLLRWPLDPATGRLQQVPGDRVIATGAWISAQSHIQGALSHDDTMWLSSSKPTGRAGVLYRTAEEAASDSLGWTDSPEDLSYDAVDDTVWSLSERRNARYVFSVPRGAID